MSGRRDIASDGESVVWFLNDVGVRHPCMTFDAGTMSLDRTHLHYKITHERYELPRRMDELLDAPVSGCPIRSKGG